MMTVLEIKMLEAEENVATLRYCQNAFGTNYSKVQQYWAIQPQRHNFQISCESYSWKLCRTQIWLFPLQLYRHMMYISIDQSAGEEFFSTNISLCVYKCWLWNTENKVNIDWNKPRRHHLSLHVYSGKQVSSLSARIHKILNIHVAWLSTDGLKCESFDRVNLSKLKYLQSQTNKHLSQFLEWLVSVFSVIDSLTFEYTDSMNIVCQTPCLD